MIKNESHISYGDEIPLNKTHHSFLNGAFFMNKIKQRSLLTIPICNANTEGQHLAFFLHIVSSMWVNIFCDLCRLQYGRVERADETVETITF